MSPHVVYESCVRVGVGCVCTCVSAQHDLENATARQSSEDDHVHFPPVAQCADESMALAVLLNAATGWMVLGPRDGAMAARLPSLLLPKRQSLS